MVILTTINPFIRDTYTNRLIDINHYEQLLTIY